jgi:hypothetical protein
VLVEIELGDARGDPVEQLEAVGVVRYSSWSS